MCYVNKAHIHYMSGIIDQKKRKKAPTDESVQNTGAKPESKNGLEQSHFENEIANPFPNKRPIHFSLSAGDVSDDLHHTTIGEIKRNKCCNNEEDFFYKGKHGNSQR